MNDLRVGDVVRYECKVMFDGMTGQGVIFAHEETGELMLRDGEFRRDLDEAKILGVVR